MNVKRISDDESNALKSGYTKVTTCGNIIELMALEHKNTSNPIVKLSNDYYVLASDYDKSTGEVIGEIKEYVHTENRAENAKGLAHSMKVCRDIINCNCSVVENVRWMTFTYAENMTDPQRLYTDRKAFWMRVKRWHKEKNLPTPEYIAVAEPQGRGAWHLHELWIYPIKAPYLPNNEIARLWKHGFVTVKKLENCDNVGAYVTAYLCDVPLDECEATYATTAIKEVEILQDDGTKIKKKYVKGARLNLYPSGMNFYRTSRGVRKPNVEWMNTKQAKEKVSAATKTFSKDIRIETDNGFTQDISYEYYNSVRGSRQDKQ